MSLPDFPSTFVTDRIRQLGCGTGPWRREDLVNRWNETTADKFIRDAKAAGWLVTPQRGLYYVPSAQDLMTVNWLPTTIRSEVLISRTLAAANLRYWCLSGLCREYDLDLGGPLFVTDLGSLDQQGGNERPTALKDLAGNSKARANRRQVIPWDETLIIVPYLPALSEQQAVQVFELPEPSDLGNRRRFLEGTATDTTGLVSLIAAAGLREKQLSDIGDLDRTKISRESRSIPYTTGPVMENMAWVVALLAALGLARADELAMKLSKSTSGLDRQAVQRHANLIGPPQPNKDWKKAIPEGPFPFLLVPPVLWDQMGADQAARRARTLESLVGGPIA